MTRIVNFSDSFVAATEPSLEGLDQENYTIQNNASDVVLFTINSSVYKSAFFNFEIIRSDISNTYTETGHFQLLFHDGSWKFAKGISAGHEIISDVIDNPFNVVMSLTTSMGVGSLKYSSGNMGSSYTGTFKISITRIVA